jgi:hypothetical protein
MTVDETLYPIFADGILAPYGNRLRVTQGIQYATGDLFAWVVFTGRIQSPTNAADGQVTVSASDRANEVVEAKFVSPQSSDVGVSVNTEFTFLVSDGVPDAKFGASDVFALTMPDLTWQDDRAGALDEMGTSAGAYWYCLANGDYVIRRYPYAVPASPILTLHDGPGGLISGTPSRDRGDVYNSVSVTGERADGSTPVFALAQDLNPASPTYVHGNFGLRHRSISLQTPQTQGSAQTAANQYLRTSIALTETWTWQQPVDAALELGDVIGLDARGETGIIQVVSGFVIPTKPGDPMQVTGRAQVIGVLE